MSKYSMTGKRNPATIYTYKCTKCNSKVFIARRKKIPTNNTRYLYCYKCKRRRKFIQSEVH